MEDTNMPILDCSVRNCMYNAESRCQLEEIKVEGSNATNSGATACGSFKLRTGSEYSNSTHMPDPESSVKCEAEKCCYNQGKVCHADHIGIAGNGACDCKETECASFYCDCK